MNIMSLILSKEGITIILSVLVLGLFGLWYGSSCLSHSTSGGASNEEVQHVTVPSGDDYDRHKLPERDNKSRSRTK